MIKINKVDKIIGETRVSNCGHEYIVLKRVDDYNQHNQRYIVKFPKTGKEKCVQYVNLLKNVVMDNYQAIRGGYGWTGNASKDYNSREYHVWRSMLTRCYNKAYHQYSLYGGKGTYVCDRWRCFEYFLEDIVLLEGYDSNLFQEGKIFLDKDIKQRDIIAKVYSPNTCMFVSALANSSEAHGIPIVLTHPDGTETEHVSMADACSQYGLVKSCMTHLLQGKIKQGHHKGYKARFK